jgi:hypothetical protein
MLSAEEILENLRNTRSMTEEVKDTLLILYLVVVFVITVVLVVR